jgi:hypothetical protein
MSFCFAEHQSKEAVWEGHDLSFRKEHCVVSAVRLKRHQ